MAFEIFGEALKLTILVGIVTAGVLGILIWKKNLTNKVSYLRIFVQIMSMAAIFYLFTYPIWLLLLLAVILIMTLVLGRFFCGWLCPFGLYMDIVTLIRKSSKMRYRNLSEKLNKALHKLKYVILLFFLIIPFLLGPIESWQWPFSLYLTGPFKPVSVLLGPLEPLIIPWNVGLQFFGLSFSYPYATVITFYSGLAFEWINGINVFALTDVTFELLNLFAFIALTIVASFVVRRFWCRFCPTGASAAIVNRFRGFKWAPVLHLNKVEEKCTKCGICKRVCPLQVTEVYEQKGGNITTSMCMLCLRCVEMCPYEGCLKVNFANKTVFKSRNWLEPSTIE